MRGQERFSPSPHSSCTALSLEPLATSGLQGAQWEMLPAKCFTSKDAGWDPLPMSSTMQATHCKRTQAERFVSSRGWGGGGGGKNPPGPPSPWPPCLQLHRAQLSIGWAAEQDAIGSGGGGGNSSCTASRHSQQQLEFLLPPNPHRMIGSWQVPTIPLEPQAQAQDTFL